MTKYIFVTGGVVSSVGKGITTAALGRLLINRGYKVMALKIDPYINVDAGTMNPFQHGEVFVTNDGAETDLDLGHYERFLGIELTRHSNFTSGAVYSEVIAKERRGEYLGQTVQLIPHITDEIKRRIYQLARESGADILITEIGGTIGDFETPPFVWAIRDIGREVGRENVLYIHVSLIAYLSWGEPKTKPTQHSVRALQELGIQPDILICRTRKPLTEELRRKISIFCGVPLEGVIESRDTDIVYEIPLIYEKQGLADLVIRKLNLKNNPPKLDEWREMVEKLKNPKHHVTVAIVGKYTKGSDAYISVQEALKHGGIANDTGVKIKWVDSESLPRRRDLRKVFAGVDGILVPGGFGHRGIEGMILAVKYARENKIPFLGLCLGMQCMVIEFARNVAGLKGANSTEFDPNTPHPVIDLMPEQRGIIDKGGTMRLGLYPCILDRNSKAFEAYKQPIILERHRHRYEFNNDYREILSSKGLKLCGLSPGGELVEMVELEDHPWMIGVQFHPEFRSKPLDPHPLFRAFVKAMLEYKNRKGQGERR
ncbi:CTP synthase [Candidatus Poribacteria bacterium]|nr:MAG: CTP synthase [Candidatus Poribacteria bacterium]